MMWRVPLQVEESLLRSAPVRIPPGRAAHPCCTARLMVESTDTVHSILPTASSRTCACSSNLAHVPSAPLSTGPQPP